jgi:hypothetical protein
VPALYLIATLYLMINTLIARTNGSELLGRSQERGVDIKGGFDENAALATHLEMLP